jgi:hypothetical protein
MSGTAGKRGTGNGTALTERPARERAIITQAHEMDRAVRLAIPGAIEGILRGPMQAWDRSYLLDLVHLLEKR